MNTLLIALLLTILIESIVAYVLGVREGKNYILFGLMNTATNLSLNLIGYLIHGIKVSQGLIVYGVLEPIVLIVEYFIVKTYGSNIQKPFRLVFWMNCVSMIGGLLWQHFLTF